MRGGSAPKLGWFPGLNYRMNEFTGGVLLAQIRKLDTIICGCAGERGSRIRGGPRVCRASSFRRLPDPAGELGTGVFIGFKTREQRERYSEAMKAEDVPVAPPERIGHPARRSGDRAEGDGHAELAVLHLRARTLDPLREGELPPHDRDPRALCRRHDGARSTPRRTLPMRSRRFAKCTRSRGLVRFGTTVLQSSVSARHLVESVFSSLLFERIDLPYSVRERTLRSRSANSRRMDESMATVRIQPEIRQRQVARTRRRAT